MSASNFNNLEIKMGIDPRAANQGLHKTTGKARKEVAKLTEDQVKGVERFNQKTDQGSRKVKLLKDGWSAVSTNITGAVAGAFAFGTAVGKVKESLDRAVAISDVRQGFFGFGGDLKTIEKVDQALLGTVDRMTTLTQLREAAGVGLTGKELVDMAKSAAFMASQLGESKASMLQMAASGQITETAWDKMGRSLKTVEQAIAAAEAKAGRSLTDTEKQALTIRRFIRESKRASQGFSTNVSQASDSFVRMKVELGRVADELGKNILPFAVKFLGYVNKGIEGLTWAAKNISKLNPKNTQFAKGLKTSYDIFFKKEKEAYAVSSKRIDDLARLAKKQFADAADKSTVKVKMSLTTDGSKTFSEAKLLALQELRGFQQEALTRIRNFSSQALNMVAAMGGPVSGILSSLKDFTEQTRIFGARFGQKFLDQVVGKSREELVLMHKRKKLSTGRLKAALLLNAAQEAGLNDMKERIITEKAAQLGLRASVASNEHLSQLYTLQVEKLNIQKDVAAATRSIQKAQGLLAFSRTKQEREALKLVLVQAKKYADIRQGREKDIQMQVKLNKLMLDRVYYRQQDLDLSKASNDSSVKLVDMQIQLRELRGQDAFALKHAKEQLELDKIQNDILQKRIDIGKIQAEIDVGKHSGRDLEMQQAKVLGMRGEIDNLLKILDIQKAINQERNNPAISTIVAKHTKQFTDGLISGAGALLTDFWSNMFAGEDLGNSLGKLFFKVTETIGDTLIAAGTQTLLMGVGSLFNPFLGANPAAIGVGGLMIAGGSLIKAGSVAAAASLAGGGTSAASTSAPSAPRPEPQSPAQSPAMRGGVTIINASLVDPYFEGNMEGRVANLGRRLNDMLPRSGVKLQPSIIG